MKSYRYAKWEQFMQERCCRTAEDPAEREAYSNKLASQSVFISFKIKGNILNVYLSYFLF